MSKKYLILSLIFIGLLGTIVFYKYQNNKLKNQVEVLYNNNYAYNQELLTLQDSLENERGVYKFTINELYDSRDKIIIELQKERENLKIKDKEIKEMSYFIANIKTDTIINITQVVNDSCEFDLDIKYNDETKFFISSKRVDNQNLLQHSADISSSFKGYIYTKSTWKEPKFFKRLIKFKWGKYYTERTKLVPSNNLVKIKDFKVIRIKE